MKTNRRCPTRVYSSAIVPLASSTEAGISKHSWKIIELTSAGRPSAWTFRAVQIWLERGPVSLLLILSMFVLMLMLMLMRVCFEGSLWHPSSALYRHSWFYNTKWLFIQLNLISVDPVWLFVIPRNWMNFKFFFSLIKHFHLIFMIFFH